MTDPSRELRAGLPPRVLALDWGTKRVGVAVTDALGMMAHPVATIAFESEDKLFQELASIIADKEPARIVVGLPVNMDGSHGPAARAAQALADAVAARFGLPVETIDERLTSADADARLRSAGERDWKKRKQRVDRVAAALILEAWLEKNRSPKPGA